jgi:hypothetical protein
MCTLSLVRTRTAWRVVCNRDESPTRVRAMPPTELRVGVRRAVMPIDPQGGGTWLAANDAGLVLAILNKSEPDVPAAGRESRGVIIPSLLAANSAGEALRAALDLDATRFRSFRLAIIDGKNVHVVVGDGATISEMSVASDADAWCAASSGLGDGLVEPARVELFDATVVDADDLIAAQDAFHRHRWADRTHMSVDMIRDGAQTVSTTAVTLTGETGEMRYTDKMTGEQVSTVLRLAGERGHVGAKW